MSQIPTDKPHLDQDALTELQEMMEGEFEFLITTFIDDTRQRLEDIKATLEADEATAFSRACHSLKGSATNLGLPRLSDLCRQGEELGHTGQTEGGDEVFSEIDREFEQVVDLLKTYL